MRLKDFIERFVEPDDPPARVARRNGKAQCLAGINFCSLVHAQAYGKVPV